MNNEKDLDELFSFDNSNEKAEEIITRAKVKGNIRIIGISILTLFLVITPIISLKLQIAPYVFDKNIVKKIYHNDVFGANGYYGAFKRSYGLNQCSASSVKYKIINDKPVKIEDIYMTGGFFGNELGESNLRHLNNSYIKFNGGENYTNQGDRLMSFYHPKIDYKSYKNDLEKLVEIDGEKDIEISLSLDKGYSLDEIKNIIPDEVGINWYWVDTFKDDYIEVIQNDIYSELLDGIYNENEVIGFNALDTRGDYLENPREKFVMSIINGMKFKDIKPEFRAVYDSLNGNNGEIDINNIKIIGLVVSGEKETLKKLVDVKEIKGSTFGVIRDKY